MREHIPYPDQRLRIVVTDSTLHQFFAPPGNTETQYAGDSLHIDYLSIAEADIRTLKNAFRAEYVDNPPTLKPMDVVIVAGYEDIAYGFERNYIMDKLYEFAEMVMDRTRLQQNNRNEANSFAVASLMYPPQLSWFYDDGPPPADYTDNKAKIDWLNREIAVLNTAYHARCPPKFHTYGVRTCSRSRTDIYGQTTTHQVKSHRWEHWRGSDPSRMMHLTSDRLFKMGTALNNYFLHNTG